MAGQLGILLHIEAIGLLLVNNMYDIVEISTENEYEIECVCNDSFLKICNQAQAMAAAGEYKPIEHDAKHSELVL